MKKRILVNKIRCKHCNSIIESISMDDCQYCVCGRISIKGGTDSLTRTSGNPEEDYEDMSLTEWIKEND